ncbi:MAG: DoxX family protein [Flavobacteriales bacterium]|nr:DoxX family protein [Flavobacteriales bacterium]
MNKRDKIIYWIATGLLTANMLLSVMMYFFKYEMVAEMLTSLSFPTFLIYPLAIAKLLGLLAIWTNKSKVLKEWAYAGFVFVFLLAIFGHIKADDGGFVGAVVALLLVGTSYVFYKRLEKSPKST